jgi:hypothetical protein
LGQNFLSSEDADDMEKVFLIVNYLADEPMAACLPQLQRLLSFG